MARIRARRLTWAGHLLWEKDTHLPRRVAIARLQKDLQEHSSLSATTGLFQDAPDHMSFEELKELAQDRKLWRALVAARAGRHTGTTKKKEGEENKKLRAHRHNGS